MCANEKLATRSAIAEGGRRQEQWEGAAESSALGKLLAMRRVIKCCRLLCCSPIPSSLPPHTACCILRSTSVRICGANEAASDSASAPATTALIMIMIMMRLI